MGVVPVENLDTGQRVLNKNRKLLLLFVMAATSHCLLPSIIPIVINDYSAWELIDSASSGSYIDYKLVQRLKLKIKPCAH